MVDMINLNSPLISVVIATRNRADMLGDSLTSVLSQTYSNLEIIVVDDGSVDNTRETVEACSDPRIRYVRQDPRGISAARNLGTDHARGQWIAVHDDDDIMLPDRLERQAKFINSDVDFIYGAFLNFDNETGELQLHHGRNYGYGPAIMSGFAPGHSTWLVRTDLLSLFRYDEGIESAVDNNLVFRMLRSGVRFVHSGVICLLRRVHSGRITDTGGPGQKYVAGLNRQFIMRGIPAKKQKSLKDSARRDWGPVDKAQWQTRFLPFLPDHLVRRSGYLVKRTVDVIDNENGSSVEIHLDVTDVSAMNWTEFLTACSSGAEDDAVRARLRENEALESIVANFDITPEVDSIDFLEESIAALLESVDYAPSGNFIVIVSGETSAWSRHLLDLTIGRCIFEDSSERKLVGLIPFRSWAAAEVCRKSAFAEFETCRVFSNNNADAIIAEFSS